MVVYCLEMFLSPAMLSRRNDIARNRRLKIAKDKPRLFVITTMRDKEDDIKDKIEKVMIKHRITDEKPNSERKYSYDVDMCLFDQLNSNIFVTILPEENTDDTLREIIAWCNGFPERRGTRLLQETLYLLDMQIESRKQFESLIQHLIDVNPEISRKGESRGSRIFHDSEKALSMRIMIILERFHEKQNNTFEDCEEEIPHEVLTSLSRLPGVKSMGTIDKTFQIIVDMEDYITKENCRSKLQEALGQWKNVNDISVSFDGMKFDWHYFTAAPCKACCGRVTAFATHRQLGDKIVFFTDKHVIPQKHLQVSIYQNLQLQNPVAEGISLYTLGVEEENPEDGDDTFVNTTCVKLNEDPENERISTSLPALARDNRSLQPFDGLYENKINWTAVKTSERDETRGEYKGSIYLTADEDIQSHPDTAQCGHNHGISIPFGHNPRKIDLIESGNLSIPFGQPGDSGQLVCLVDPYSSRNNHEYLVPVFVYVGKCTIGGRDMYLVSRLQSAIKSLQMKHDIFDLPLIFTDPTYLTLHGE